MSRPTPGNPSFVDDRPNWESYFFAIAKAVATRGDCRRPNGQVGAVLVGVDYRILGVGYNGSREPKGPSCLLGQCPRGLLSRDEQPPDGGYAASGCEAVHAEENALKYADLSRAAGGTAYVTRKPCPGCQSLLHDAGFKWAQWIGESDRDQETWGGMDLNHEYGPAPDHTVSVDISPDAGEVIRRTVLVQTRPRLDEKPVLRQMITGEWIWGCQRCMSDGRWIHDSSVRHKDQAAAMDLVRRHVAKHQVRFANRVF